MSDDDFLDLLDILSKLEECIPFTGGKYATARNQARRMISTTKASVTKRRADRLEAESRVTKE